MALFSLTLRNLRACTIAENVVNEARYVAVLSSDYIPAAKPTPGGRMTFT